MTRRGGGVFAHQRNKKQKGGKTIYGTERQSLGWGGFSTEKRKNLREPWGKKGKMPKRVLRKGGHRSSAGGKKLAVNTKEIGANEYKKRSARRKRVNRRGDNLLKKKKTRKTGIT